MPRTTRASAQTKPSAAVSQVDALAGRLRAALPAEGVSEQRMFGGIGFMLNGNMVAGSSKHGLLLRVGKERYGEALMQPGARPMEMRGRPVEGYLYIDRERLDEESLRDWLRLAINFVGTLPPKAPGKSKR